MDGLVSVLFLLIKFQNINREYFLNLLFIYLLILNMFFEKNFGKFRITFDRKKILKSIENFEKNKDLNCFVRFYQKEAIERVLYLDKKNKKKTSWDYSRIERYVFIQRSSFASRK